MKTISTINNTNMSQKQYKTPPQTIRIHLFHRNTNIISTKKTLIHKQILSNTNTNIISNGFFFSAGLDGVCHEAQDSAYPQEKTEASEQLLAELHPLRNRLRRTQLVWPIPLQHLSVVRCFVRCLL